ncbi:MAG: FAD-binding oxidoreductase [Novosphingobium sp.]
MADLADLAACFSGRLLTAPDDMAPFLADWRDLWHGRARAVAQPDTTEGVAAVVRWCAANGVPIVPQGGNTSMSGGATPDAGGEALVLSLARLNRVRAVDPINDTITLDAGCVLAAVQQAAEEAERLFPLSLGAEGSCTIGGNLATNAGGTAVLRYGNMRELCLGLEVVTAEGEVWNGLRGLRKDNSGYDLRDLFIGSEGTLGIITGAVLKLFPRPSGHIAACVGVRDLHVATALLTRLRRAFDSQLTSFEIFSDACLALVEQTIAGARSPLAERAPWYALVELSVFDAIDARREQFEAVLVDALEAGIVQDAAIAESEAQRAAFWRLRESISEAQAVAGKTIKHDIALPISSLADFVGEADAAVAAGWPSMRFITFGHLGDGNLHYNFSPSPGADPAAFLAATDAINLVVHDIAAKHGGTFSAEHGLGVLRRDEAVRLKSPVEMALMRRLKQALDPQGLLNPGKVLA